MNVAAVIDQHVEEAGFLAGLRDHAVRAPHYDLAHLLDLDNRIEAHLDALQIGGLRSLDLVLKALDTNAEGEVFVAAILVFRGTNGTALAQLCEHLRRFPEGARFFAAALSWLDWGQARPWVERLLASPEPLFRAIGLAACGMHRHDPGPALLSALGHADPAVLARAART
ncbi:MAG: hypothetical protein E7C76_14200, partial [Pseudomonas aeruginosa]|nr:hypothetical protein [Pseudomonas aeruginosa]